MTIDKFYIVCLQKSVDSEKDLSMSYFKCLIYNLQKYSLVLIKFYFLLTYREIIRQNCVLAIILKNVKWQCVSSFTQHTCNMGSQLPLFLCFHSKIHKL